MSASRKGLKRLGMRSYEVTGPKGAVIIERDRPRHFLVRPAWLPRAFDYGDYRLLRDAAAYARRLAGDLEACLPRYLDRRPR